MALKHSSSFSQLKCIILWSIPINFAIQRYAFVRAVYSSSPISTQPFQIGSKMLWHFTLSLRSFSFPSLPSGLSVPFLQDTHAPQGTQAQSIRSSSLPKSALPEMSRVEPWQYGQILADRTWRLVMDRSCRVIPFPFCLRALFVVIH